MHLQHMQEVEREFGVRDVCERGFMVSNLRFKVYGLAALPREGATDEHTVRLRRRKRTYTRHTGMHDDG